MIVEHSFPVSLAAPDAMLRARAMLCDAGFETDMQGAVAASFADRLELSLRRQTGSRLKSTVCEQKIRLTFDGGMLNVAAGVWPKRGMLDFSLSPFPAIDAAPDSPQTQQHAQMMIALAEAVESLLVKETPPAEAAQSWRQLDNECVQAGSASPGGLKIPGMLVSLVCSVVLAFAGYQGAMYYFDRTGGPAVAAAEASPAVAPTHPAVRQAARATLPQVSKVVALQPPPPSMPAASRDDELEPAPAPVPKAAPLPTVMNQGWVVRNARPTPPPPRRARQRY